MEKIIEQRLNERRRALEEARQAALCIAEKLGNIVAVVYGSYARGDFNEWSDIDLLVATTTSLPASPLERLNLVEDCLAKSPHVDLVLLTVEELRRNYAKNNPATREAVENGVEVANTLGKSLHELVAG